MIQFNSRSATIALLIVAAILEVGGDAMVRAGLRANGWPRFGFIVAGALGLLA